MSENTLWYLPNEILFKIVLEIQKSDDVKSFALCCERFAAVVRALHPKLKKKFLRPVEVKYHSKQSLMNEIMEDNNFITFQTYARAYEALRIMSGMEGLQFSN